MSICVVNSQSAEDKSHTSEEHGEVKWCQKLSTVRPQPIYQKLIIKHAHLKKLSLWGCSGLDVSHNTNESYAASLTIELFIYYRTDFLSYPSQALYLNCPELNDLNLNSCTNLHPG